MVRRSRIKTSCYPVHAKPCTLSRRCGTLAGSPEQIPIIRQRYYDILDGLGLRSFFEPLADRVTLSSEVGVFKPDEKIFRAVIEKIDEGLRFGDVVFITENRRHVIEARRLGMRAIHFQGPGQNTGDVDRLVDVIPLVQKPWGFEPTVEAEPGGVVPAAYKLRSVPDSIRGNATNES